MEVDFADNNSVCLSKCYGNAFYDKLQEHLDTDIPIMVGNILLINDIDRAVLLASFDKDSITHIEHFMRHDFAAEMCGNQPVANYLGKFVGHLQAKFVKYNGHKMLINLIAETCRKFVATTSHFEDTTNNTSTSNPTSRITNDYETIDQPVDDGGASFLKYIGSLMITIFNDAKRLTLSGWSRPSRHAAAEKSHEYRATGNIACTPKLNYVTPGQHKEFLNYIVQGDTKNFAKRLIKSKALSVRIDGSVDRTQDHNVYVMGHLVNDDYTILSVFIGFDIPKQSGSLGCFECVKIIVTKILPWEVFIRLISSVVTDGEGLNLGCNSGLHVQFMNEIRNLFSDNKTLLSIWCYAHRINLAWKDVCKQFQIISTLVEDAAFVSAYFHKSGVRTFNLKQIASDNKLSKPLRYVTYFPVRWTEYIFDLLNVTLRNWRVALSYFISKEEIGLEKHWLLYDRIHMVTFLADILRLFKIFQKEFESSTITKLDVQKKRQKLFDQLQLCMNTPIDKGWEQLFLSNVDIDLLFYGHTLLRNRGRSTTTPSFVFNADTRKSIIQSFLHHLDSRLDYDLDVQNNLKPLASITSSTTNQLLKLCHTTIIPDLNEHVFYTDYKDAANLLKYHQFKSPLDTLQKLHILQPTTGLKALKIALARVIAAKPHSADVETLIATYKKVKTFDRSAISGLSLFNYLYIKVNMPTLDKFDPHDALQYWTDEKIVDQLIAKQENSKSSSKVSSQKQTKMNRLKLQLLFHFEFEMFTNTTISH